MTTAVGFDWCFMIHTKGKHIALSRAATKLNFSVSNLSHAKQRNSRSTQSKRINFIQHSTLHLKAKKIKPTLCHIFVKSQLKLQGVQCTAVILIWHLQCKSCLLLSQMPINARSCTSSSLLPFCIAYGVEQLLQYVAYKVVVMITKCLFVLHSYFLL